jgi:hypothetical protein
LAANHIPKVAKDEIYDGVLGLSAAEIERLRVDSDQPATLRPAVAGE